jgi:DHA1 family multidrug resistance protein-like MFS transporter
MTLLARDKAAVPSYSTLLFICCGVAFGGYLGSHMRIPVVPLYARSLGADAVLVGIINSAFLLTAALLSLPLGMMSDRLGRKRLACIGALILSATSFLLYFSKTPWQMVWIYLFFGIGLAAFGPTMMSLVADISPATHLGRSYGWYTTALYTSMSLGPALGGLVAKELGYVEVFLISGVLVFITFWLILLYLPRARHMLSDRARNSEPAAAAELLQNRPLVGCWLVTLGGCFGLGMFVTFFPLHAHNQGLHVGEIGLVFAVQGVWNGLCRIPFGYLSDRVARRGTLVIIGLLGFSVAMVGFALSKSLLHFLLTATLLGISMGLAFTSVGALIAEVVDQESRGLAMGGYNTCIYFGMMLSSALMGGIIQRIGYENSFHLTALLNFLLLGFFYLFMKNFDPYKEKSVKQ